MNQDLWYVAIDGDQLDGQYTTAQVRQIAQQNPGKTVHVWKPGMAQWTRLDEMREMGPVPPPAPRPMAGAPPGTVSGVKKKKGAAIASLILGILSLCVPLILVPFAWTFGIVALVRASKRPNEYGGRGAAVIGTVMSVFSIVLWGILLAIAIPNFQSALERGRQMRTMADMKALAGALEVIQVDCGAYPMTGTGPLGDDCQTPGPLIKALIQGGYLINPIICDAWKYPMEYPDGTEIGGKLVPAEAVKATDPQCVETFGDRWSDAYSILSRGRDGQMDCGYGRWEPSLRSFQPGHPAGTCAPSTGQCDGHDDFDCDITFGGDSFVHFPSGMRR